MVGRRFRTDGELFISGIITGLLVKFGSDDGWKCRPTTDPPNTAYKLPLILDTGSKRFHITIREVPRADPE